MITKPCKLQDPEKVKQQIEEYFQERIDNQEIRELKTGDKRVYRKPPSIFSLCEKLGISEDTFANYTSQDPENRPEHINNEIVGLLMYARKRMIDELYEGVQLGYWNERVTMAQLQKFGVIGNDQEEKTVKVIMQGSNEWSR